MTIPPTVRDLPAVAEDTSTSEIFSVSRPVSASLLDNDWLSGADRDVFIWGHPAGSMRMVGLGASVVHLGSGPIRFHQLAEAVNGTLARIQHLEGVGPGPRFVGGFGFGDADPASDGRWAGYPAARMVLPEVCLIENNGDAWAVATTTGNGRAPAEVRAHLHSLLDRLTPQPLRRAAPVPVAVSLADGSSRYRNLVAAAASEIAAGAFRKLVVSRAVDATTAANPGQILEALRARYPDCVTYAITAGNRVFLGATPEPLVERRGRRVSSIALAGTIARGTDPATDEDLASRLKADPKEREEHQHVVSGIRQALAGAGVRLERPAGPSVRKLATVQHLETRIAGKTDTAVSLIELAGALHPTPAVGGLPTRTAVDWIIEHEQDERGWYAGPIGYVDADGDGEFHVALRCALLEDGIARCFVGAGIVAGSDPDRELAETTAKLRAIAGSLAG